MSPTDFIPITGIAPELLNLTGSPGPGYRRLLVLCADARIAPPMQQRAGRWGCLRSDLPALVEALGLTMRTPIAPRGRRKAPNQPQAAA